jgi:hypothetical protein
VVAWLILVVEQRLVVVVAGVGVLKARYRARIQKINLEMLRREGKGIARTGMI